MEIRQLVGESASVCPADLTMREAARQMTMAGIGSLGVMSTGSLVGIITERDVLRAVAEGVDLDQAVAGDFMSSPVDCVEPDLDVTAAASWLLATGYRHLPVVEEGRLLGIASIKDVLWAIAEPADSGS